MPRPNVEPQRRREIVEAAIGVFAERGLASSRMEDVATAAGISKGTVYLYYPGKEALVLAVVDALYGGDAARLGEQAPTGTSEDRLRAVARGLAVASTKGKALLPLVLDIYGLGARDASVRNRLSAYFDTYRRQIREIIADGEARGELRAPGGPDRAALAIVAAFEGIFWLWALDEAGFDLGRALDEVLTTILGGLRA